MPGGRAVGQPVFDHQADRQGNDTLSVVAAGRGEVGAIGAEMAAASDAVVPGVGDAQHTRSVAEQGAEVMQRALPACVAVTGTATARAATAAPVPRAPPDEGRGEVFNARDSLGTVRDVFSGSHDR